MDDSTIRLRLPTNEQHLRPGGTVSGPTLVWLADVGFYLLIVGQLGPVALAVTTNLNINFNAQARSCASRRRGAAAEAWPKPRRRRHLTIWSDVKSDPAAHVTMTNSMPLNSKS